MHVILNEQSEVKNPSNGTQKASDIGNEARNYLDFGPKTLSLDKPPQGFFVIAQNDIRSTFG